MQPQRSTQWDLGRFAKTLSYFGVFPVLSSLEWFQRWLGSRPDPILDSRAIAPTLMPMIPETLQTSEAQDTSAPEIIWVASSGSDLGHAIVRRLGERGYDGRSLVPPNTQHHLSGTVIAVDPQQLSDLTAAVFQSGHSFIGCTEGVNSEWLVALIQQFQNRQTPLLFDFRDSSPDLQDIWGALDDVVMGGVSESNFRFIAGSALFAGVVSTANSGGFASVRTRNFDPSLDLSDYDGLLLRVKGDGQRYKVMLRDDVQWDSVAYCLSFDTVANNWITVPVPFAALKPIFRAKTVTHVGPLTTSRVRACQLMLSKFEYDGALNPHFQPGAFQLQVESIGVYRQSNHPQVVIVSPVQDIYVDSTQVRESGEPFQGDRPSSELALESVVTTALRDSGLVYTHIHYGSLTTDPAGQPIKAVKDLPSTQSITPQSITPQSITQGDLAELCVQAIARSQTHSMSFGVENDPDGSTAGDWDRIFAQQVDDT